MQLHLDLDYIVRRVEVSSPWREVKYWVSPATLVFDCMGPISGDLRSVHLPLQMRRLQQVEPTLPCSEPGWYLEGNGFLLKFSAWRFTLHLRRPPQYGGRVLRMADRGGISFERRSFA
ncbi:hypothetical protein ACWD4V_29735 [Streptomyces tsukubensis]